MTYHEVHKLHRQGYSISYISDYLGMNWKTVKKDLGMNDREYEAFLNQPSTQWNKDGREKRHRGHNFISIDV